MGLAGIRIAPKGPERYAVGMPVGKQGSRPKPVTYRVAQVGAYKPMGMDDNVRWIMAARWLLEHDTIFGTSQFGRPVNDIINLIYERDFLQEKHKYDIVLLHSLFDPKMDGIKVSFVDRAMCGVSDKHSLETWHKRFVSSEAKYIFVFESYPMSLSGWSLGQIPGYVQAHIDSEFAVYKRRKRGTEV